MNCWNINNTFYLKRNNIVFTLYSHQQMKFPLFRVDLPKKNINYTSKMRTPNSIICLFIHAIDSNLSKNQLNMWLCEVVIWMLNMMMTFFIQYIWSILHAYTIKYPNNERYWNDNYLSNKIIKLKIIQWVLVLYAFTMQFFVKNSMLPLLIIVTALWYYWWIYINHID